MRDHEPKPRNAELSPEDALRLQVMLENAQAIRIDEGRMTVYGLTPEREMSAELNPICHPDRYVERVRQMLSTQILGAPGGYPVFIQRWTRTGDITAAHLDRLLMLGDPEAALAVARAPDLTAELAARVWWAAPTAEIGRALLAKREVVESPVGREIAEYLLELLPFETEHLYMLQTLQRLLQPGLIPDERRERLWRGGRARSTYLVGFMDASPNDLPDPLPARPDLAEHAPVLAALAEAGNPYARLLRHLLDSPGQSFLAAAEEAMRRPPDQEVVGAWLNAVGRYFAPVRVYTEQRQEVEPIREEVAALCENGDAALRAVLEAVPGLHDEIRAMLVLAHIDDAVATPVFARTDAVGSVMRKQIGPVLQPVLEQIATLRGRNR